jgi:hypothetical protein
MKVTDELLMPLVFRWLVKGGYEMAATALQMSADDNLAEMTCDLHKKKLSNVVKFFVKGHPGLLDLYKKEAEEDEVSSEEEVVVPKKKSKKDKKAQKKSKKSQEPELEVAEPEPETLLAKRPRRKSSASKMNGEAKVKPEPTLQLGKSKKLIVNPVEEHLLNKRVKIDQLGDVNLGIKDNSFATKLATGGVDEYGKFGHQRLGGERGKGFRKEKQKLKNKAFAGETIVYRDNSLLLD